MRRQRRGEVEGSRREDCGKENVKCKQMKQEHNSIVVFTEKKGRFYHT